MGRIFLLMGKSSSGKDSFFEALLNDSELNLKKIIPYTTRPIRAGEEEGKEYHFVSMEQSEELETQGKVIEERVYQTIHGPWKYMTVDDGQIDLRQADYIAIGTLDSYRKLSNFFGGKTVVPIYIYVETGERLQRALDRERNHANPKYAEMCRRFLADEKDFSDENLVSVGLLREDGTIRNGFENVVFEECFQKIRELILEEVD